MSTYNKDDIITIITDIITILRVKLLRLCVQQGQSITML